MRIIFVTQAIDPEDPVLGFTTRWVRALAERFDRVAVIANRVGNRTPDLGSGVELFSMGKEKGRGRLRRGLSYEARVFQLARLLRPHAFLAHMCPVYLNVAAPILKGFRIPSLLWFAHPSDSRRLQLAEALADQVLTSLSGAYPRITPKLRVIGQATDTQAFSPVPPDPWEGQLRLMAIGRTSPSKRFDVAVRAVGHARRAGLEVVLRIVGPSTTSLEHRHRGELEALIAREGLHRIVSVEPGVPVDEMPRLLRWGDVLVNGMVAGSGDKVVFEAMSMGRLVLTSNPAFGPMLEGLPLALSFHECDPHDLAQKLVDLNRASPSSRERTARMLRERVEHGHSLGHWAACVLRIVQELQPGRSRSPERK